MLLQRLAELQVKLQYLDSMNREKQEHLQQLSQRIQLLVPIDNNTDFGATSAPLKPEVKMILRNISGTNAANGINPPFMLRLPSTYHFLPHLLDDPHSLKLGYLMSKGRAGVSVVLGIPTVRREKQSYLIDTLTSLIDGMKPKEALDTVLVVFVAETDLEYVLQIAKEVEMRFPAQVDSGLVEVVAPSPSYYPDLSQLRTTLGDPMERVKWRSKQNLDYAFLMSYCQPKGTLYVQLEDDILAKPNYITKMKEFAIEKTALKKPWFVLDFCQLGFIGKMFKSAELPWLIHFFQMFYNDKPVDWLLGDLLYTKACSGEKPIEHCKKEKAELWLHYRPSLFQHIGTHSSLKGKLQKLKDKNFGKLALFYGHKNPEAFVTSAIKHYKTYSLQRAYEGKTFFWGLLPQAGDCLTFNFSAPILLKYYLFRSGNVEHPADKFYNTTVEILPINTEDYVVIGKFNSTGIASGTVEETSKPISSLRLHVHSDSENWAILSEIMIRGDRAR
nr:alpha-1,3-mannosyl-glycoprotein 4-beta-N-acetylglucosaminyltransferase B [Onthophagus taurus]